ncbi:hypothetical protein AQUCO_00400166v1 [Aquilegia coerulea]|uniref:Cyclin-dependent protein kinase inhibitor SMR6 n=1 Tax=Aquilegia coerulea TaxID=218851 RepID=A0A2G5ETM7_AQUCA|nr:hypothetical protein AQUCO_00400166v1 [Aquilegia coerulea]
MGFSEKHQVDGGIELKGKKWVVGGIPIRAPLTKIKTKKMEKDTESEEEESSTTPTSIDARIPERFPCPPPPRKRRPNPSSRCNFNGVREFFNPPDLESVFIRHVET